MALQIKCCHGRDESECDGQCADSTPCRPPETTEGLTDEQIQERACQTKGCVNWSERGYIHCEPCMHGTGRRMPARIALRKLELEAEVASQAERENR